MIICGDCNYVANGDKYTCVICGDTITKDAFEEFRKINEKSNLGRQKESSEKEK